MYDKNTQISTAETRERERERVNSPLYFFNKNVFHYVHTQYAQQGRFVFFIFSIILGSFLFMGNALADFNSVYLNYASNTAGSQILDVYQEMNGAGTATDKWVRWRLKQYSGGNGAWEVLDPSYGRISTLTLETDRDDFTYNNGSDDSGGYTTWTDYSIGNIVGKRRDSLSGYNQYSAFATYTATADYDEVYLGVHNNSVNGIIRIKINDVISSSGIDLNSNGEYDEAAHGSDNTNVYWIHIGSTIHNGDVIKIEVKGDTTGDRHTITGLRFYNNEGNPGDSGWTYVRSKALTSSGSSQSIAISGHVDSQVNEFMFGVAHAGHEYNANLSIDIDGTIYTLGDNLMLGQTASGSLLTAEESSTGYGDTQTTDDFGTLNRTFTWHDNIHTQSWSLDFTTDYVAATVYASMWPTVSNTNKIFRYADVGSNFVVLLPNGIVAGSSPYASSGASNTDIFYGGIANLKMTFQTTAPVTSNFIWVVDNEYHKAYFRVGNWEKTWHTGETMGGHTTTFTLDYQTPESIDWNGKTLYVAKPMTISDSTELLPFDGNNLIVKYRTDVSTSLTFTGVAPVRTSFTSGNDDSIGSINAYSTGAPTKGDWAGITVSGNVNVSYNVINYATTGLTLSDNTNAYNNTLYNDSTGINAAVDSIVENNIFSSNTTNTTGAGAFDYNTYSGNIETNGKNEAPYFPNLSSEILGVAATSTAIDAGTSVGLTTDYASNSIYGVPDIGAYEYQPPYTFALNKIPTTGSIRLYSDGKYRALTATTSSATGTFSVTPVGGFYTASTSQYMDVTIDSWLTSGTKNKQWTATSSIAAFNTHATSTVYTIGDLAPSTYYKFALDSSPSTTITGDTCNTNGSCLSDANGSVTFTYTGGYSTHTFALTKDTTAPASFTLTAPANNDGISKGGTLSWTASSDTESGLAPYELYIDDTL
ncbi:MAG: hypothetical protein WC887_01605, partial [Candidatus Paceibacterota bacterium]